MAIADAPEKTRCQARFLRSICLRPKGGAALTMGPQWEDVYGQ
jgi:hypothetical protein